MPSTVLDFSNLHKFRVRNVVAIADADLTPQKASVQITDKPGRITGIINMRRLVAIGKVFKLHDADVGDAVYAITADTNDDDDATILHADTSSVAANTGFTGASIPYTKLAITYPRALPADTEFLILYEDAEYG